LRTYFGNESSVSISNALSLFDWHHVTLRYNAEACQLSLFVNGTNGRRSTLQDIPNVEWVKCFK